MTQADRMHSMPPTNTFKNRPVDPTRRHLLTIAAGGAVAGLMPTAVLAAAPAVDPVFELIENHRQAHIAHMAALSIQSRFERRYGIGGASWVSTKPCHDENNAFEAFVAEPATTVQHALGKRVPPSASSASAHVVHGHAAQRRIIGQHSFLIS